jgi:hypothetical protein
VIRVKEYFRITFLCLDRCPILEIILNRSRQSGGSTGPDSSAGPIGGPTIGGRATRLLPTDGRFCATAWLGQSGLPLAILVSYR